MGMMGAERRHRILERVAEQQSVRVAGLATECGVSEMTIRRDIGRLAADGLLRRVHGGATSHGALALELTFNARSLENGEMKRLIGMRAAALAAESGAETLFVGMGTTIERFAQFLADSEETTLITGALGVAVILSNRKTKVILLGGHVRKGELSCHGPTAALAVHRYHADLTILGAAGLDSRQGLTELYDEEAEVHRAMIEQSDELWVLADASKWGTSAMSRVTPLEAVDCLVTDSRLAPSARQDLQASGVKLVMGDDLAVFPGG